MNLKSKYPEFDRALLKLRPLEERDHDLELSHWLNLTDATPPFEHAALSTVANRLIAARERRAARILMIGGHVLKSGVNRHIIDWIERGVVTHIAMNGACAIHDFELAMVGATTESVARYIRTGEFGMWTETGWLNDCINASPGLGFGEAAGRHIAGSAYPHRDLSLLAAAYRADVPATVHVGLGYDIIHEHANCDGAAVGAASYRDFLIFANGVQNLEGGVVLSFGSAVMAPEVYLKALSMARNVARQQGREIRDFTTAVFDLMPMSGDFHREPPKTEAAYYFRPRKTMLIRTVADGGSSYYFEGDHRTTLPALWRAVNELL
jgi:hypothetical protein